MPRSRSRSTYATRTAPAGDYVDVASEHVVLTGQTAPGATVVLRKTLASGKVRRVARTRADAQGTYRFVINCGMGTTPFTARGRRRGRRREQRRPVGDPSQPGDRLELDRPPGGPQRRFAGARFVAGLRHRRALGLRRGQRDRSRNTPMYGDVTATVSGRTSADAAACRRGGDRPDRPLPQSGGHVRRPN